LIGQNQISRGYNNILKKRDHSEVISQNIKTIIGREPNEGELSFIIKWYQTHFKEKLISSLVNSDEGDRVLFSANHCIGNSKFNKSSINKTIMRAINDIQCKGGKVEKILLYCQSPHSEIKGIKGKIRRVQQFANRKNMKTYFSFSNLHQEISIIVFAISKSIQKKHMSNVNKGDLVLLFSCSPDEPDLGAFLNGLAYSSGCCIIKRVENNDIPFSIASFSRFFQKGITINKTWEIKSKNTFIASIINKEAESLIKNLAIKYKISLSTLGTVSSESDPVLRFPEPTKIDLPISCLEIFNNDHFTNLELNNQVQIRKEIKESIKTKRSSLSFNDTLLELMSADECIETSKNSINDSNRMYSFAEEQKISNFDAKRGAEAAFASAIRKIVSHGVIPEMASLTFNFPKKLSDNDYNYIREFSEGIKFASSILDVPVLSANVFFDSNGKFPLSTIIANGPISKDSNPISSSFKNPGDFILSLGSHRGELRFSVYARIMECEEVGPLPMIDLIMERQIRQVILTGNQIGIIKSVTNVSEGGLSTSIANSIIKGGNNIGARIHLSTKIENKELLFGETRGFFLISISEESMIEIERLCMNLGVPCTAIGRVTDNGQYTFNDLIDIKCDKLIENQEKSKNQLSAY